MFSFTLFDPFIALQALAKTPMEMHGENYINKRWQGTKKKWSSKIMH